MKNSSLVAIIVLLIISFSATELMAVDWIAAISTEKRALIARELVDSSRKEARESISRLKFADDKERAEELIREIGFPLNLSYETVVEISTFPDEIKGYLIAQVYKAMVKAEKNEPKVQPKWLWARKFYNEFPRQTGCEVRPTMIVCFYLESVNDNMTVFESLRTIGSGGELRKRDIERFKQLESFSDFLAYYLENKDTAEFESRLELAAKNREKEQIQQEKEQAARERASQIASLKLRTWHDKSLKHTTEAAFKGYKHGVVELQKADLQIIRVGLSELSFPDQKFVREQLKAQR
ncbi:hypothetical protein CA13_26560 [Planctomycetes bacterium CA13]|uniref:SLA1 homology domain-containing protein n=1 Tax=Novipirellula herctigrandis TaxID=2527986 RepID=A0A5C5Z2N6_9BACT|nr:hypothetical protein CA13_26560 [Planctomycetes bacterium CA13]